MSVGTGAGLTRPADFPLTFLIAWKQHCGEDFRNLRRIILRSEKQPVVGQSPVDARGQAAYDTCVELGKMLTSLYLMDYFLNPEFRAEVRHALNRGEAMRTLQRAIHDGQIPNELANASLLGVSSALSLLSNIVVAWNTEGMQAALDGMRAAGAEPPSQDLRHVAPTNVEGINLRGTCDFPVEKYAECILPSSADASSWPSGVRAATGAQ